MQACYMNKYMHEQFLGTYMHTGMHKTLAYNITMQRTQAYYANIHLTESHSYEQMQIQQFEQFNKIKKSAL